MERADDKGDGRLRRRRTTESGTVNGRGAPGGPGGLVPTTPSAAGRGGAPPPTQPPRSPAVDNGGGKAQKQRRMTLDDILRDAVRRRTDDRPRAAPVPVAVPELPGLGDKLVELGLVRPIQLSEATIQQAASGKSLGTLLVELGAVSEQDMAQVLASELGLPLADLRREEPDPEALELLSEATARSVTAIPLHKGDGAVEIAVADPLDGATIERLRNEVGVEILLLVAPVSDIQLAIETSYRAVGAISRFVEAFEATEAVLRPDAASPIVADDAPVVQVVNLIITQGLRDRASDIHIEPQDARVRVRFRIDGALHDALALPDNMGPALVSRLKIMADMNIVDRRKPQDGQIAMEVDGRPVDIRINTSPTIWGEKAVLRLLDRQRVLFRFEDLGMPADAHATFSQLVKAPFGMVICAGPTGCGKTTTLYATLTEINHSERNVTTVEDPVEYIFPSINQMQINPQAGITFAGGLRALLRQDPDIILVGEIRDAETARMAVESAMTGHLVLSSLHATDACSGLQRFVDMGIEPFLIASTVTGVVSQRLIRRICTHCRVPYRPGVEELAFYRSAGGQPKTAPETAEFVESLMPELSEQVELFWQGEGCNFCSHTGFQGRIGVFELLKMSGEINRLLIAGATADELRAAARREGMRTLLDEGVRLVAQDLTTIAEVMRSIYLI